MTTETKSPASEVGNWHDPTNAYNDDSAYAYCGNGEGGLTHDHDGYGFAAEGTIKEVRIDVKGYSGDGSTHTIKVYVWDGSTWHLVGTITSTTECFAHQFDATSYIDTVAKLNAIKTRIESVGLGGGKPANRYVRVCWIPVYADYSVAVTYKIEGITKDAQGDVLGGCDVRLHLSSDDGYITYTTSDAVTGAYSFTGLPNNDQRYVIAYKAGTPVFGTTDNLTPVEEQNGEK